MAHNVYAEGASAPYTAHHSKDPEAGATGGAPDADYVQLMEGAVRQGFIKKVYALLTVMLTVTFSTVALFSLSPAVQAAIKATPAILGLALAAYLGTAIALTCCGDGPRRRYPTNYILLAVFTAATSIMVGVVSATYAPESVALAAGLTLFLFAGLTAFAWQTKIDFTPLNQGMFSVCWGLLLLGLVCALYPSSVLRNVYATLGAVLFSFFIIIDTQMLVGGKREFQLGPDDYVMAALQLYCAWVPREARSAMGTQACCPLPDGGLCTCFHALPPHLFPFLPLPPPPSPTRAQWMS
jgi:FtsH-binding integral membrane protein